MSQFGVAPPWDRYPMKPGPRLLSANRMLPEQRDVAGAPSLLKAPRPLRRDA